MGNNQYSKDIYGNETWYKSDENGSETHIVYIDGGEEWHKYNAKGKEIYCKTCKGQEAWFEYDTAGNEIHSKYSDGTEEYREYNENGKLIRRRCLDQAGKWTEYDEHGYEINSVFSVYADDSNFDRLCENLSKSIDEKNVTIKSEVEMKNCSFQNILIVSYAGKEIGRFQIAEDATEERLRSTIQKAIEEFKRNN